jgi:hypothetical protein
MRLERLVHEKGRTELRGDLARSIAYRAELLAQQGASARALQGVLNWARVWRK